MEQSDKTPFFEKKMEFLFLGMDQNDQVIRNRWTYKVKKGD
jgi:hypothetical protein